MWGSIVGGLGGGLLGIQGQREANAANAAMAAEASWQNRMSAYEQMDFQANMSNTAHVREVRDLKNAGLNPILSATGGASTPMGASANAVVGQADNVFKDVSHTAATAVASARESKLAENTLNKGLKELDLLTSQAKQVEAATRKTNVETSILEGEVPKAGIKEQLYNGLKNILQSVDAPNRKASPADSKVRDMYRKYKNAPRVPIGGPR